jgi:hypothetical protein
MEKLSWMGKSLEEVMVCLEGTIPELVRSFWGQPRKPSINVVSAAEIADLNKLRMESTIFWDITPCSPLKVNRHFGGAYRLQLQGRRISRARNQRGSKWKAGPAWLILRLWSWRRYVSPKRWLPFNGLRGVISLKIVLFTTTALKTSNPT